MARNKTIKLGSKEFQELKQQWYARLEESGFKDAETDAGALKREFRFYRASVRDAAARAAYFRGAVQFLYDGDFASTVDKRIWRLHSEGLSLIKIADAIGRSRHYVDLRVRKYATAAGLRRKP